MFKLVEHGKIFIFNQIIVTSQIANRLYTHRTAFNALSFYNDAKMYQIDFFENLLLIINQSFLDIVY